MSLQQQLPDGGVRVRWVGEGSVGLVEETVAASFLLLPDRWEPWPPDRFEAIDEAAIDRLLATAPELVLLGTGTRQRFLPPALQARILARGIGVECMDNAAAARTFNLLADEGRHLVAAFLIET
ncbi:MAG: hypothetical protein KatS3mg126_1403 [Lysobacteraceae bacterium]|nr:MAG: hypothetical protein KatS3mg126_1403 [Xanthomonadaceae bacterium]